MTVGGTTTELTAEATYIINKRQVTLTSATDSKVYDGKPLTNDEVTVSGDGWAPATAGRRARARPTT